jgi:hypothetical protein
LKQPGDRTDLWLFQVYVNSYIALLNARHYLQVKEPEIIDISDFRAHRPSLHSWQSEAEDFQDSGKDAFKHPYYPD